MTGISKPFTGRHFTLIMVGFFGIVIAVNLVMARYATATFGGVVVDNSYVASQHYNTWLGKAKVQQALGWSAKAQQQRDGRIALGFAGAPADLEVTAVAQHPLGRQPDVSLRFDRQADGRFLSREVLPSGRWRLRVAARVGATEWRAELEPQ